MTAVTQPVAGFDASRAKFESLVGVLEGEEAGALSHADLEDRLQAEGRELLRLLSFRTIWICVPGASGRWRSSMPTARRANAWRPVGAAS